MSKVPEFEVISLKEIRCDLLEFFRQIDAGRKFVVYARSTPVARVGKAGEIEEAGILRAGDNSYDPAALAEVLFETVDDARMEMRVHEHGSLW